MIRAEAGVGRMTLTARTDAKNPNALGLGNGTALLWGVAVADTYRALAWVIKKARADGKPIPPRLLRLEAVLSREVAAMSPGGRKFAPGDPAMEPSSQDLISTAEVAKSLGVSPRTVWRRADELGALRLGGRLVFDRLIIALIAERQTR